MTQQQSLSWLIYSVNSKAYHDSFTQSTAKPIMTHLLSQQQSLSWLSQKQSLLWLTQSTAKPIMTQSTAKPVMTHLLRQQQSLSWLTYSVNSKTCHDSLTQSTAKPIMTHLLNQQQSLSWLTRWSHGLTHVMTVARSQTLTSFAHVVCSVRMKLDQTLTVPFSITVTHSSFRATPAEWLTRPPAQRLRHWWLIGTAIDYTLYHHLKINVTVWHVVIRLASVHT